MGISRERSLTVVSLCNKSVFFVEHHQRGPQLYAFPGWNMVAVEADFFSLLPD